MLRDVTGSLKTAENCRDFSHAQHEKSSQKFAVLSDAQRVLKSIKKRPFDETAPKPTSTAPKLKESSLKNPSHKLSLKRWWLG